MAKEWPLAYGAIATETYEASTWSSPKYNRVMLSHDVDAEVVLTLLAIDPLGVHVPYWVVVGEWAREGVTNEWPNPNDKATTVWTVVQRATAAHQLRLLIGSDTAEIRWARSSVAVTTRAHRRSLVALAVRSLGLQSPWFRRSVFTLSLLAAGMTAFLVSFAHWDTSAIVAGVGLPAVLSAIVALGTGDRRDN